MKKILVLLPVLISVFMFACEKEEPPDDHLDDPVEFVSLEAARTVIFIEDTTRVTAKATGYELSYHWSVEKGDILGSGSEITYVATPCTVGDNEIYCTVKSSNGKEETKHVIVTVL